MRNIQYYRPNNVTLDGNAVLVSGQCPQIKDAYLAGYLNQAAQGAYKVVVLDFGRTGDFSGILYSCGFHSQHLFVTGRDNYAAREIPIREAVLKLRTHAQRLGYEHFSYSQMTAFLSFLMKLEMPSERSNTIGQLLRKFSNQEKLERILLSLVRSRAISGQEAEDNIQTYLEYAASGVTADTLLSELDFIMTPCFGSGSFSLSALDRGEAAVLCASDNNSSDINDYMARLWTADLIGMSNTDPLMIVINTGHHSQVDRMYELVETLSHRPNVNLFYTSYDLFSGVSVERAKAFAKMFRYNIYGTHTNDSAQKISSLFSEHWLTQFNYADAHNQRVMGESLLDKLLGTDRTKTVSTSMVKESIVPAYSIVELSDREFFIFDTLTNAVRSASV